MDCSPWDAWHQPHCWGVGPQSSLQLLGCSQNRNYRTQVKSLTCNVSLQPVSLPDKSHVWMLYVYESFVTPHSQERTDVSSQADEAGKPSNIFSVLLFVVALCCIAPSGLVRSGHSGRVKS